MDRRAKRPAPGMAQAELAGMPSFASLRSGHATRDGHIALASRMTNSALFFQPDSLLNRHARLRAAVDGEHKQIFAARTR